MIAEHPQTCTWEYVTWTHVVAGCDTEALRPRPVEEIRELEFCPHCRRPVVIEDIDDGR